MKKIPNLLILLVLHLSASALAGDPLPSWNEGGTKSRILNFVRKVEADSVPLSDRIAVFDNDGTLWTEQPMYIQAYFAIDQVKAMAVKRPEWKTKEPFQSILEGKHRPYTQAELAKIMMETHAGMNVDEFQLRARQWIRNARHPQLGKLFKECTYKPMVELLRYLRSRGFKTFIVSGGGVDFMRSFAEEAYGIPSEQVIGSSVKVKFQKVGDQVSLVKLPQVQSVDDHEGKAENIYQYIGKKPILAFGNSDGDQQMLEYTASHKVPTLNLILRHDDAVRETAYDRQSAIGRLDRAWDEAVLRGWNVVSMKNDFKEVFDFKN